MNERFPQATEKSLLEEIGVTDDDIARRLAWLEFTDKDAERVRGIHKLAQEYSQPVIDELYKHFMKFDETRAFFKSAAEMERVKNLQKEYFLRLTEGRYDRRYFEDRARVGSVHSRIGLDPKWFLGAYNFHLRRVAAWIFKKYKNEPETALDIFMSLTKLKFLDISLALESYIFQGKERTIRMQQEAIRELSTPVLQVRERLLILPIIGIIDSQRARQLTESLLRAIRDNRAKVVILDITGVPSVDSKVANHLIQTVDAARLMGAIVIVSGLSAEVAQALVTIGVDLSRLRTIGDLQGGIEEAERILGYRVVKVESAPDTFPEK